MTLSLLLLGIASSLIAELVSLVNTWLGNGPFKGQGAWWIAAVAALLAGFVKEFWFSGVSVASWSDLLLYSGAAFGISQAWFGTISTWFSSFLQVSSSTTTPQV